MTRFEAARSGSCDFTVTDPCWGRILSTNAKLNNRIASLLVYENADGDVIPPFLIGEIAGSLSIEFDRQHMREFAVSVLDWLERTETEGNNVVRNVPFGCSKED